MATWVDGWILLYLFIMAVCQVFKKEITVCVLFRFYQKMWQMFSLEGCVFVFHFVSTHHVQHFCLFYVAAKFEFITFTPKMWQNVIQSLRKKGRGKKKKPRNGKYPSNKCCKKSTSQSRKRIIWKHLLNSRQITENRFCLVSHDIIHWVVHEGHRLSLMQKKCWVSLVWRA